MERFLKFKEDVSLSSLSENVNDNRIIILRESKTTGTVQVQILEKMTEYQARAILSMPLQKQKMILYEIVETEKIPSARKIMQKKGELNDYSVQKQGIIFEAPKPWHYNAQKYIPQNVIESISSNILRGTNEYKLKVLRYTIESAWNYITNQGLVKKMIKESTNPLVCKICNKRFFDNEFFKKHKC